MTALNNNKETSINPMIIMDKAIDMSTRLSGSQFPVSIFPAKIQRIIKEVHECHSFPTDYISAAILTALAVGIGNTHLAQMKQGWLESPILYMALIGRPGANKSHPLSFAMKPFLDYDYEQNKLFEEQYSKFEEKMCMSRKERIENGEDGFPQEPVRKRFLVSDVTPEGLSYIHAQNKRGLCLWTDELSAWFKNFNRYNNGSEEQFWLSVFSWMLLPREAWISQIEDLAEDADEVGKIKEAVTAFFLKTPKCSDEREESCLKEFLKRYWTFDVWPKIEEVADKALKLIQDNPDALGKYENLKEFLKDFDECRYKFSEMSHAIVSNEN